MPDQGTAQLDRKFAIDVVQQLRDAGYQALWAGGCVRDQLLKLTPSDYDVATNATPSEIRNVFGHRRTLAIGAAFGVITVLDRHRRGQVEVATFRCDAGYSDGRHPDHVTFSTAQEDAQRRDFTINGLFYDPIDDNVIDFVDGQRDLELGVVRAIGDPFQRIAEDKLRMLRAARFATTFNFRMDSNTLSAIRHEAEGIRAVSAERVATEMRRMLINRNRHLAVQALREMRLLTILLPEANVLFAELQQYETDQPLTEDPLWQETLAILRQLEAPKFRVALAALLWHMTRKHSDHLQIVPRICERWKLSNHESQGTLWLLTHEQDIRNAMSLEWHELQPILISPDIEELLQLATAITIVINANSAPIDYCREKLELAPDQLNPAPFIRGNDLLNTGLPRGPIYAAVLSQVRAAQLDGKIACKEEALKLARSIIDKQTDSTKQ